MVEWIAMKDLFSIKNGYTPSKNHQEYWDGGTIPWFRMEDIRQNGTILKDSIQHITPLGVKKGGLFPANSIIVATTATIGEHALIIVDSLANQQFTFLTKCKLYDSKLDMKYMYYYMFVVDEWCKKNTNVSGFASVDMDKFKKLLIPIPSLSEQNRIVSILDTFTASIDNLKAQIAQRRKQYEFYRDQLLDLEGKPEKDIKLFGEVCEILKGNGVQKTDFEESGFGCIHYGQIYTHYGSFTYETNKFVSEQVFKKARKASRGDIIMTDTSENVEDICKSVAYLGEDDIAVSNHALIIKHQQNAKFLSYTTLTKSFFNQKRKYAYGVKVTGIKPEHLAKFKIFLPSLSEQDRIVSILDTFEASISNLEVQLEQRQKQYEYYRNQLLTFD